jgi:hypothetical protein
MVEVVAFAVFVLGIYYAIAWTIKHDPEADARKQQKTPFMKNTANLQKPAIKEKNGQKPDA